MDGLHTSGLLLEGGKPKMVRTKRSPPKAVEGLVTWAQNLRLHWPRPGRCGFHTFVSFTGTASDLLYFVLLLISFSLKGFPKLYTFQDSNKPGSTLAGRGGWGGTAGSFS